MKVMARGLVPYRFLTRECKGGCGESDFHTHHLTRIGRWYYKSFE